MPKDFASTLFLISAKDFFFFKCTQVDLCQSLVILDFFFYQRNWNLLGKIRQLVSKPCDGQFLDYRRNTAENFVSLNFGFFEYYFLINRQSFLVRSLRGVSSVGCVFLYVAGLSKVSKSPFVCSGYNLGQSSI